MKRRGLVIWAVCCVGITLIAFAAIGAFYTGYSIEKNNREQNAKIEEQRIRSNQQFCGIFKLILTEGRPGPFKDAVARVYNSPDYQCDRIENQNVQ